MAAQKSPTWTKAEVEALRDVYPTKGLPGACVALPGRSWHAIQVKAHKLGLRSPVTADAPQTKLQGSRLEEAIRLREAEGWSFARIGAHMGVCESSACNAVLIALCPRKGFTPAQRDDHGRLTDEGIERLRLMLRKGLKAVDIQLRLGLSASTIAEQRRRYAADLKARGKAPLPPAGGGEAYSGARIPRDKIREAERLLMTGLGGPKVADQVGVSKTHVQRIRGKLVKRLRRKGECLPGCDTAGKRRRIVGHVAAVPAADIAKLRQLLLQGVPVARAAVIANMGGSKAYKVRDELRAELDAEGRTLPSIVRLGRKKAPAADARAAWLPKGRINLILYRTILRDCGGNEVEARRLTVRAIAKRDGQDPVLAEQLDRLKRGGTVTARLDLRRPDPAYTLGGVATGALC
jgi:predicted DNA-binding protein (UPF0251 family)